MDYTDLRTLEVVARHGSMNRAATELNTVQSNVTARIRALETSVGSLLFDRTSRGVRLTAAGQRLLPYAQRVAALLREARDVARDDGEPGGQLRIGSLETTAALRLPPILSTYASAYPRVGLTVTTGTSAGLVADVLDYRLDAAFVAGPVQHVDLSEEAIYDEELVLVTAPSVRTPEDLDDRRDLKIIVFRHGCSYRQRLEELLARRGLHAPQSLEFGSLEAIVGCVAAGIGITLLPRSVIMSSWRDGRIAAHELAPDVARVKTVFVCRHDRHVGSALAAFLSTARPPPVRLVAAE